MQFIYIGEATFYEERIDQFLSVAKSLQIKELYNAVTEDELNDEPSSCDKKLPTKNLEEATFSDKTIMQTLHERQRRAVSVNGRHEGVTVKYVCDQCDYQDTTQSYCL